MKQGTGPPNNSEEVKKKHLRNGKTSFWCLESFGYVSGETEEG